MRLIAVLLVAMLPSLAYAESLACPNDADSCELQITGKLTYARRDQLAKWDNLRIATKRTGNIKASINIPHRTRLALKVGTRYRFKVAARKPFDAHDIWVIDAHKILPKP